MFRDREDAGIQLAARLRHFGAHQPVVIGLPRGGVPVACAVAKTLHAPLDVIVVRKLGVPVNPELGFGAVSEEHVVVYNQDLIRLADIEQIEIDAAIDRERREVNRRVTAIRKRFPEQPLKGRTVIIVDDGIATGIDAKAACRVARARGATRVVLATPVAPRDWKVTLAREADDFVAVLEDPEFIAVGAYYLDFAQISDDQVLATLDSACLTV